MATRSRRPARCSSSGSKGSKGSKESTGLARTRLSERIPATASGILLIQERSAVPETNRVREKMSRRVFLKLGVAGISAAAALFLSACGGGEEEEDEGDDED